MTQERLSKLRQKLQENKLDAFLATSPENRRYLSGFTGSAGYLVISQDAAVLATDFRYIEQGAQQAPQFRILRIGGDLKWFPKLLKEMKVHRIGFEGDNLTVGIHHMLHQALKVAFPSKGPVLVATSALVDQQRAVKDPMELTLLTKAIHIADNAFDQVAPTIRSGDTEEEVAWRLEVAMREQGAESISFDLIVAAGPNAALPHHRASETPIKNGEPVIIDMGAKYQGYCSDLSRTFCLGEPDETFKKVYDIVLGAQLTAIATVKKGMTGGETDGLARTVIQEAGYGDSFGHSLGHGVGLAIHEYPRVGPNAQSVLEDNMVFTIEPGIYIPGWGGVRIEDVVVLENGVAQVISKAKKLDRLGG